MKGSRRKVSFLETWQWNVLALSTLFKLALIPSYHSTDFEVHRHWLAITHSLPISQWYFDETSIWTLDYPPFFAYFSYILSIPAKVWDPQIVNLNNGLEYDGWKCVLYMRLSVIISELILAGALFALSKQSNPNQKLVKIPAVIAAALLLHPGLIIVDHIHFQYNGFLFGILLWSIWAARENRYLLCAFLFSTLLNFKHIYIYIAPAYFIFLLQAYIVKGPSHTAYSGAAERFFTLAFITLIPFALSVIPLAMSGLDKSAPSNPLGILSQMLRRLFPFSRGLNHAYWAANIWALYTFTDRVLVRMLPNTIRDAGASASRGIVGDITFTILPQITANHCFLLTLVFTILFSLRLYLRPTQIGFLQAITLFALTSFLFGFHVHEKAILLALIPLTLLSPLDYFYVRMTLLLSIPGIVALFPLLYQVKETPVKYIYTILWSLVTFRAMLVFHFRPTPSNWDLILHYLENAYLIGFLPLQLFVSIIHPLLFSNSREIVSSASSKSIISIASASASQASASLSSIAQSWTGLENEDFNTSISTFLTSAGEALSSDRKALQEQVVSAVSAVVDFTKEAVSQQDAINVKESAAAAAIAEHKTYSTSMEFLPLMLTSVYCALGVTFVWLRLGYRFLSVDEEALGQTQINSTGSTTKRAQ